MLNCSQIWSQVFTCLCLFMSVNVTFGDANFAVVGYMPEWRFGGIDWDSVCPFLTDLLLFSIEVDNDANFAALDRLPDDSHICATRRAGL